MGTTRKAVLGAFVLGGLLLFVGGLFLIGDRRLLFDRQFELNTTFSRVTGLEVGTSVRLAGLEAGEVLNIVLPARPSERFRIRMRLREDLRPLIRADSVSAIQTDGILGSTFIQMSPGTDQSPIVESGDTIMGRDPIEFSDLIEEGRDTFRAVSAIILDLGAEVSGTVSTLTATAESANRILVTVGDDLSRLTRNASGVVTDVRGLLAEANGVVEDVRGGQGAIGQLLTDDSLYTRWVGIATEAEQTVANLRSATDHANALIESVAASDGAAEQIVDSLTNTLAATHEVIADLSEGTEALKRNFLFRGFFQERGFFDLDAVSRDAYLAGALERSNRTALRVWVDARVLFEVAPDGRETLTEEGRRRLDSAMADLVKYPRDSPLVVEGYAESGEAAYLTSADRAELVRDYVVRRFRRPANLTGAMALSDQANGSPRNDGRWSGVALTLFAQESALSVPR